LKADSVVFELHGGIGNQLFQYAAGDFYSREKKQRVCYDISHVLYGPSKNSQAKLERLPLVELVLNQSQIVGGSERLFLEKIIRKMPIFNDYFAGHVMSPKIFKKSYESQEVGYDPSLLNSRAKYYFGYFQSYKYCSDFLRDNLTECILNRKEPTWVDERLSEISEGRVLLLHARFFQREIDHTYLTLDSNYYLNAIKALGGENAFSKIWLLTNDKRTAELTLSNELPSKVEILDPPEYVDDLSILHLMVAARNLVIANSTFSWWGAYLGAKDKRVLAPKEIFQFKDVPRDYYPSGWIQIT
jgi:hypothetical protein